MPQVVMRDVLVDEGDFVEAGQVLANIQSDTLQAQLAEAEAQHPGYRKL
jgi:HlyD family secretion protein